MKDTKRLTRAQAIRAKCIDCMCGQLAEVRLCPSRDCPLYSYRMGREGRGEYGESEYFAPEKADGQIQIPVSVFVSHAVADGYHTCKLINDMQEIAEACL